MATKTVTCARVVGVLLHVMVLAEANDLGGRKLGLTRGGNRQKHVLPHLPLTGNIDLRP